MSSNTRTSFLLALVALDKGKVFLYEKNTLLLDAGRLRYSCLREELPSLSSIVKKLKKAEEVKLNVHPGKVDTDDKAIFESLKRDLGYAQAEKDLEREMASKTLRQRLAEEIVCS